MTGDTEVPQWLKGMVAKLVGWEFKSELDLLLLMLCEDNKAIMVVRVKENCQHPNKIKKSKEKSNFNMQLGKAQEKTEQRKLIIRSRRSTTLLCHPELEGVFSAGTKGVSITAGICTTSLHLFGGPCERSTPFRLRPYEFCIFRTTEIPFGHCS